MRYSLATSFFLLLLSGFAILQVLCGQISAANQLSSPKLGAVRYADGSVHLLYGLPGNYVIGPRVLDGADKASFSQKGGLVAQKGLITLLSADFSTIGTFPSGEEKPLSNIDGDLKTAIAWLPSAQKLVHWNGQAFTSVSAPYILAEGEVSSLSKRDDKTASLLLRSSNGSASEAVVSLETGRLISVVPVAGAHGRTFRQKALILFENNGTLVITKPSDGNTRHTSISGHDLEVERISSDCLHVRSRAGQRDWILHFRDDDFDLAELPPPASGSSPAVPLVEVAQ